MAHPLDAITNPFQPRCNGSYLHNEGRRAAGADRQVKAWQDEALRSEGPHPAPISYRYVLLHGFLNAPICSLRYVTYVFTREPVN